MTLSLPANPSFIRTLRDTELDRLFSLYDDRVLPRGPHQCITCGGVGSFLWRDPLTQEPATYECNCDEQYVLCMYLLNAGIDLRYQRLSYSDTHAVDEGALKIVIDYIDHDRAYVNLGLGLLFHGTVGTGKTLLATLLLKRLLGMGYDGYFTTFQNMIHNFTSGWYDEDQKRWFMKRVTNTGILVIDDIGRERQGRPPSGGASTRSLEMVESMMDDVIRSRVAGCRPTFITTNKTLTELRQLYLVNVMSLLSSSLIQYEFTGDDYRATEAMEAASMARLGLSRPITLGETV